ncbi:LysR family transcriptional regulator [Brachybacterium hainanense]|uniref:LysR family transcriptional regulator n=1 Tax=Brachybacterium hainanense TaxID=1541174 RepID=A0ABV6R9I5_9MICO
MLDPLKLRVLRSVVETGSVRASAEALGYTPSAVSQHLSALRRDTGLELVERSGRGIVVTPAGRTLAAEAGTVLDALDALERTARGLREGRTGTLSLSYASSVAAAWVPVIARDVRERFPELGLELTLRDCTRGFPPGYVPDIVIGETSVDLPSPPYISRVLLEEGYSALVGREHPLAGRSSLPLTELAAYDWATDDPPDSDWFGRIASACRAAGFAPRVAVNPSDFSAVLGFVASGDFVSVQPSIIASELRPDIVAIPLAPPGPRRRLSIQVHEKVARSDAARFVVERTVELARARVAAVSDAIALS